MADRPLAFWLALVDRLVEERFSAALEEHGVTRTQWRVLGLLAATATRADELRAGLTDEEFDEIDELVESGWITGGDPYVITEAGDGAYERLADVVEGMRAQLTAGLSPAEQDATIGALERMARNLGWSE